jgi:hypothetical protein
MNDGAVLLLRAAGDGSFDLCYPGEPDAPYKTYSTLADAEARLRFTGYQRVEGRS